MAAEKILVIAISKTSPDNEVRNIPVNNNLRLIDVGNNPRIVNTKKSRLLRIICVNECGFQSMSTIL